MSNLLSNELISQFAKATVGNDETKQDPTLRGTITRVVSGEGDEGVLCVKIDGSDIETPVSRFPSTIEDFAEGDRVEISVKNHALTITGNTTNKAIGKVTEGNLRSEIAQTASSIRLEVADESAKLQSSIELTASEIRSEVSAANGELDSKITQTAESITQEVNGLDGKYTELKQTVDGFTFEDDKGKVWINNGNINLTGAITWKDLDSSTQTTINNATPRYQYSSDGINWHDTMQSNDKYRRESTNGGSSYGPYYQFKGTDGQNGKDGSDADVPGYITETYIDGEKVESPVLRGGVISGARFSNIGTYDSAVEDYVPTTWIEVGKDSGRADNDAYGLSIVSTYYDGGRTAIFSIWNGDFGYVGFGVKGVTFLTTYTEGSTVTVYPNGTWNFRNANVEGLDTTARFG